MECPICSEVFNEEQNCPRLLSCGHTCCEECLNQVIVATQITCPTCRNVSVSPSPSSLPKNYIVLEFIANNRLHEAAPPKLAKLCALHPDEPVIRYCIDDERGVCAECIIKHSAHKLVKLDDPALEFRFECSGILESVQQMRRTVNTRRQEVQLKDTIVSQLVQRELERIEIHFAKLWEKIEERKAELKEKVCQSARESHERIAKELEDIGVFSIDLEEFQGKMRSLEACAPIQQTLANCKREVHVLSSTCQKLGNIDPTSLFATKTLFHNKPLEAQVAKYGIVSVGGDMMNPSIFCFGTQNTVLKFHLGTQRWTPYSIKESNGYEFKNFASIAALPNGSILITGGTKSNEIYEYSDSRMTARGSMLHIRSSHNAVYYNGFVYCIGGYNGSAWHDKCEKVSTETFASAPIASLHFRRCAFSSCVVGNHIYVFGGYDGSRYLDSIQKFSISKNKWEVLPCVLHRPLQNTGAACYAENKVMIAGGYNEKGTLSVVRSLNLETLEWTTLPSMNYTRYLMNKFHCCGGCVFAIGGTAQGQNIEYFNVAEGRWVCMRSYRETTEDTMYKWAAVITDDNHSP